MSRIRADIGIHSRLSGYIKADRLRFPWPDQFARKQNLVGLGNKIPFPSVGFLGPCIGTQSNFFERSWLDDYEVVGHVVGIRKPELNGLAGLKNDSLFVIDHSLNNGSYRDGSHIEIAESVRNSFR